MDDMKRGDDAADHAPRPKQDERPRPSDRQDAPNYDKATDKGHALKDEDVNSANDE